MIEEISDFLISLLPSNALIFIIYLVFITVFSVLLIILLSKKKNKSKNAQIPKKELTIDDLLEIAKSKKSNINDLKFALEYFLNHFKIKDDEKKSFELFEKILNHKNRSKILFNIYHGKILPENLEYKNKLDSIEKKALNK